MELLTMWAIVRRVIYLGLMYLYVCMYGFTDFVIRDVVRFSMTFELL